MNPAPLPTIHSMISDMEDDIRDVAYGAEALILIGSAHKYHAVEWAGERLLQQAESLKVQWRALLDVSRVEQGSTPIPPASRAPR